MQSLWLFIFVGLFTPGPNVIMLTTSGARFGFAPTLPHLAGVVVGVGITSGATALGLGALLQQSPELSVVLKVGCAAWILRMAYGLYRAAPPEAAAETDRPMRFTEAVLFQWINPKVWAVALSASATFTAHLSPGLAALVLGLSFSSINLMVCLFWSVFGALLAKLLQSEIAWRYFKNVMAALLAASAFLVAI